MCWSASVSEATEPEIVGIRFYNLNSTKKLTRLAVAPFLVHRRNVMTQCQRLHRVSDSRVFRPPEFRSCRSTSSPFSTSDIASLQNALHFVKTVRCVAHRTQMESFQYHGVLSERSGFVGKEVRDAAEFLGDGRAAHGGAFHRWIVAYRPGVEGFAHVEVDAETVEVEIMKFCIITID